MKFLSVVLFCCSINCKSSLRSFRTILSNMCLTVFFYFSALCSFLMSLRASSSRPLLWRTHWGSGFNVVPPCSYFGEFWGVLSRWWKQTRKLELWKYELFRGSARVRHVSRLFVTQTAPMWRNGQRGQNGPQQQSRTKSSWGGSASLSTHPEPGGHLHLQPADSQDQMRRIQRPHPAGDPHFRGTVQERWGASDGLCGGWERKQVHCFLSLSHSVTC